MKPRPSTHDPPALSNAFCTMHLSHPQKAHRAGLERFAPNQRRSQTGVLIIDRAS